MMPLPSPLRFIRPKLVVKNITNSKEITVLDKYSLAPGNTVDLFQAVAPGTLTEDQIIRSLFLPDGDMYVEVVTKRSLQILEIDLPSFYYSKVFPTNLIASNQSVPGSFPVAVSENEFKWYVFQAPLVLQGDALSIPKASPTQDGYLSKEDYALFASVAAGGNFIIWQYQDFSAPVGTSLTLTSFQNGAGLLFDASYIVNGTATIVLVSDTERPPTSTLSIPGVWLPSNRVEVTSHIGTTVILNQAPESSLPVRVFYQIALPAGVSAPAGYVEDPNFVNERELNLLDDFYVNQNGDETIYGEKTFADSVIIEGTLTISDGAYDGYYLRSNATGQASWAPVTGGSGTSDHGGLTGLLDDDHPQYFNQVRLDAIVDGYEPSDSIRLIPSGGSTGQALVKTSNVDYDVNWEDVATGSSLDLSALDDILDGYVQNNTFYTTLDGYVSYNVLSDILDGYTTDEQLSNIVDGYIYDATNIGDDGYGVFFQKSGNTLEFKNISVGSNQLSISQSSNNIVLDVDTDFLRTQISGLEGEPTGFPTLEDSIISFDDVTRTFTISPAVVSFDIYCKAKKFVFNSSQSVILPNITGLYYVFFDKDAGVLTATISFDISIITQHAWCAMVYWNAAQAKHIYLGDERHGVTMDGVTHAYLHQTIGAAYLAGLAIDNLEVDESGGANSHAQFSSTPGTILDEDIRHNILAQTQFPVFYRLGSENHWYSKAPDSFPVIYSGTAGYTGPNGRLAYNYFDGYSWSLEQVPNSNYVLTHVLATNDIENPVIVLQGNNYYQNRPAARAAARSELESFSGLPFTEYVAVATIIFQTANTYTNTPKARTRSVSSTELYVDWRQAASSVGVIASDHGLLTGLSDDDHTHYYNSARLDVVLDGYVKIIDFSNHINDLSVHFTKESLGLDGYVSYTDLSDLLDGYLTSEDIDGYATYTGIESLFDGYFYLSGNNLVSGHTTFDPVISTDPALTIVPNVSTPITNVADGSVVIIDGIQYNYDGTRAKWISNERKFLVSGRASNNVTNSYLNVIDGIVTSDTGYRAIRNAVITGIWAQTRNSHTWTFEVRRNKITTPVTSLSIVSARGNSSNNVNVNLEVGDEIQFYLNGTNISRPVVGIEIAWRLI
jgi:hypothetical protein